MEGLGVTEPIAAELYKLLIYDQGSFFVSHRDTEKSPGMFATLVIVLPSISAGGERSIIRHKGREVRLDLPLRGAVGIGLRRLLCRLRPRGAARHRGFPGRRWSIIWSAAGKGWPRSRRAMSASTRKRRRCVKAWVAGKRSPDDDAPEKIVYPLERAYTPAELGFAALKGADAAVAGVLAAAAPIRNPSHKPDTFCFPMAAHGRGCSTEGRRPKTDARGRNRQRSFLGNRRRDQAV